MQFERFYSLNDSVVGSFPHLHHLGFQTALPNLGKPLSGGIVYCLLILLSVRYIIQHELRINRRMICVFILAREVATCLLLEVMDPKKASSDYLSKCNGRFSWAMSSTEEKNASIGMRATNDPLEREFATFTEVLATGGYGIRVDKGISPMVQEQAYLLTI